MDFVAQIYPELHFCGETVTRSHRRSTTLMLDAFVFDEDAADEDLVQVV